MKEAMRCHPGVSYPLERIVPPGGAEFCGTHIREGTILGMNPTVIHKDTTIFGEDAAIFNPNRWLGPDEEHIKRMDRHLMTVCCRCSNKHPRKAVVCSLLTRIL